MLEILVRPDVVGPARTPLNQDRPQPDRKVGRVQVRAAWRPVTATSNRSAASASRMKLPIAKLASSGSSGPTNAKPRAILTSSSVSAAAAAHRNSAARLPWPYPADGVLRPRCSEVVLIEVAAMFGGCGP